MTVPFYEYLAALVPPAVLVVIMFRLLLRPDVRLLGRRRIEADGVRYLFAVHNAEEVPLEGRIVIHLETVLHEGRIWPRPTLLCGPRIQGMEEDDVKEATSRFTVTTPRLRAQSTWIVLCSTNGKEGDLRLTVTHQKKASSDEGTFTPGQRWTQLGSGPSNVRPTAGKWRWMVGGTLLALLTYVLPIHFRLVWPRQSPMEPWNSKVDAVLIGALLFCSLLAFWLCRPRPGPIILGHMGWEKEAKDTPDEAVAELRGSAP